jgi:putative transposase
MKKTRFTERQIIKAIKENEQGRKVEDISRELGINPGTFYNWRKKYAGMEASQIKELKALQEENSKLKRMYAEQALQITMLKDVIGKKW